MDNFVQLHGHSEFSSLDGFCRINELVKKVSEIEQSAIAVTDHGSVSGAYKFHAECKKNGIKPIIGSEMYISESARERRTNHITLLCQNKTGWNNLVELTKIASHKFYYKPRIELEDLLEHSEGIICLSGCIAGLCSRSILEGDMKKAKFFLETLSEKFKDRFFLEIMDHGMDEQKEVNKVLRGWSKEYGIRRVGTNDYHYVSRAEASNQDILLCDQMKKDIDDPTRMKMSCDEFFIKTRAEMSLEEAELDETVNIADSCELDFTKTRFYLPSKPNDYKNLVSLIQKGLNKLNLDKELLDKVYLPRLRKELKVIKDAGLMGYFLTVEDYVKYAKDNGILVGPGRGSVGGCLVAYLLNITEIDPIKYNLLFSRFYNEGRKGSLPDIDIDFPDHGTNKVIDYVTKKYGQDHVSYIGTFMRMGIKGAVKLVCRVIKPDGEKIDFAKANEYAEIAEDDYECLKLEKRDKVFKEVMERAEKFVGLATHHSIHAAGLIISDTKISDIAPLLYNKKEDKYVTAWDMRDVEEVGLVKFDFLSLATLDIIQDTLDQIDSNIKDIPFDDEKAFQLIATTSEEGGVFQMSSSGMIELASMLVPTNIEDIAVLVALYRPGPLGSGLHRKYIKRKFEEESVDYLHPMLEPILKDTYGLMIYQEQALRICMDLARFSEAEADTIRKGIGKKIPELIDKMEKQFISGCLKSKVKEEIAKEIWDQIVEFTGYSFNKAHAIGYATITYYTAYLKAHYPVEFMAATLNNSYNKKEKLETYLKHCNDIDIEVLPPSINNGEVKFSVKDKKIIFGMRGIKGVGTEVSKAIKAKKYKDYSDFLFSVRPAKDTLQALIESGSFDDMGYNRNQLLRVLGKSIEVMRKKTKVNPKAKSLLTVPQRIKIPDVKELDNSELSKKEYNRLNTYISYSPIKDKDLITPNDMNGTFLIEGFLISLKKQLIKKNKTTMGIGYIYTKIGTFEVLFFPKVYKENLSKIIEGDIICIKGTLDSNRTKIIAKSIYEKEEWEI